MQRSNQVVVASTLGAFAAGASAYFLLGNRITAAFKRQDGKPLFTASFNNPFRGGNPFRGLLSRWTPAKAV